MHIICAHSESKSAECVCIVFILLVVSLILGAPVSDEGKDSSVYNSLINTCPLLTRTQFQKYSNFTRQQCGPLKNLIDFKVEEHVKLADVNNVLCLLFFNSFNSSCSNQTVLKSDIFLDPQIEKDVSIVCKKLPQILSEVTWPQNLSTIFQVEDNCNNLCIETSDLHRDICILSFGIIQYSLTKHISNNTTHSSVPQIEHKKPDHLDNSFDHSVKVSPITGELKDSSNDTRDQNKKADVPSHSEERTINDTHPAEESSNLRIADMNTDNNDDDENNLIKHKNSLNNSSPHNEGKSEINGNPTAKKTSNSGDIEIPRADMNTDNDNLLAPNQQSQQNILPDKQGSVDEISEDGLEDPRNVNAEDNNENNQPYIADDNIVSKDIGYWAHLQAVILEYDAFVSQGLFNESGRPVEHTDIN